MSRCTYVVLLPYKCIAKQKTREEAEVLRLQGNSISDIADKLAVSKSTVSLWCRDLILSEKALLKIVANSKSKSSESLLRYTESLRKQRQLSILSDMKHGAKKTIKLSDRDIYCIGLGFYWGEGYKKGNQEFGFTNSDPKMILFYIKWLKVVFNVSKNDLIFRISINNLHKNREKDLLTYWSGLVDVPSHQFTKISFIKTKSQKQYVNMNEHFGTLRIKVRKGTTMRREILGALNQAAEVGIIK